MPSRVPILFAFCPSPLLLLLLLLLLPSLFAFLVFVMRVRGFALFTGQPHSLARMVTHACTEMKAEAACCRVRQLRGWELWKAWDQGDGTFKPTAQIEVSRDGECSRVDDTQVHVTLKEELHIPWLLNLKLWSR